MKTCNLLLVSFAFWVGLAGAQAAFPQAMPSGSAGQGANVEVPFVGCASDGQGGPEAAPARATESAPVPAAMAQRLAFYEAKLGFGALAPRGWYCFSTYGSDGINLFVSPDPIDSKTLLSPDWRGFTGQAVQISYFDGETSGRFEVAKIIARVFPAYRAFANYVIAERIEPASDFPFGPYPKDKLTYRSDSAVEFKTPANSQGLGTNSRLQMNASPIEGVAIITEGVTDLIQLSVRLSDRDLIPVIVRQVESHEGVPGAN